MFVPRRVRLGRPGRRRGVKVEFAGGLMTVKLAALLAVPAEVVTLIGPVVAPAGTVAVIAVAELTVKLALVDRKSAAEGQGEVLGGSRTLEPTETLARVKLVIVGGLSN